MAENNSFKNTLLLGFSKIKAKIKEWNKRLKKRPVLNIIVKGFGSLFLLIFIPIFLLISMARIGIFGGMPSNDELRHIKNPVGTEVIADDDKQILGRYYIENRTNVTYDSLPENLIHALISTEDIRYYEHSGIDWKSWARVLWKTIILGEKSSGGGSTISQQLAKSLFKRRTYWRGTTLINKVREIIIAQRLEKFFTKEDLLTMYFNTVSFGGTIFGIEVAAKQFFNTTPSKLKTEQSALLVGMLKATTKYNPLNNPKDSKSRRNTVLSKMERYGYLSKNKADSLMNLPIVLDYQVESHTEGNATYFREYVRQDIQQVLSSFKKDDGTDYNIYTDGLKIYTSINYEMQLSAEKQVKTQVDKLQNIYNQQLKWNKKPWEDSTFLSKAITTTERYKSLIAAGKSIGYIDSSFNQPYEMIVYSPTGPVKMKMSPKDSLIYYLKFLSAGFMAAEPSSGYIKAWVGGIDNHYFQYDHVTARRHVGSTFKPIVYATALEKGLNPCDYYNNQQVTYHQYDDWTPKNYEGGYGGKYSMAGALKRSLNCVTVDLIMKTGIDSVIMYGHQMGITTEIPHEPAIALGAVDISLYDMMTVYSTIANKGIRPKLTYIRKVVTRTGKVLIDNTQDTARSTQRALSENSALMVRKMMEGVVNGGTAGSIKWLCDVRGNLAGKTGTTQDNADGWFIGFSPNLIAGAWVGGEFPEIHLTGGYTGANTALPIVGYFMHDVENSVAIKKYMAGKFEDLPKDLAKLMSCADMMYSDTLRDSLDSIPLDSLGNPLILPEPGKVDEVIPSSSDDTTKKRGFFDKLFNKRDKEPEKSSDDKQKSKNIQIDNSSKTKPNTQKENK